MQDVKTKVASGIMLGGISSFLQQILGLIIGFIIARRLSPSDYGMVGMLTIFTTLATIFQECGFVLCLANKKQVSRLEYSSVFWFNIASSFLIYVILFFLAPCVAAFFKTPELVSLSRYTFLGFLISSFGIVQDAYYFREIKLKEVTIASVTSLCISGVVGILMAYNGFCYWGIVTQSLVSILLATIIKWMYSPFRPMLKIDFQFIREILPNGFYFAVPNFLGTISSNIFSVILGRFYTSTDVGNYAQATKWSKYPQNIILNMFRNVVQPALVQYRDDSEKQLQVFRKFFRMMCFIAVPVYLGLAMVSLDFILTLLGEQWLDSAYILQVLCIGLLFSTLTTLFSYFILSLNKNKVYMYIGTLNSIVTIVLAFIASRWGVLYLAWSFSLLSVIWLFIYSCIIYRTHRYNPFLVVYDLLPSLSVTLILIFLFSYLYSGISLGILSLCLKLISCLVGYVLIMILTKNDSLVEIYNYIKHKNE